LTAGLQLALGVSAATGVAGACVHHATYAVRSQWLGPTIWRGPVNSGSVALTFDDGPSDDTERILDKLAAADVRAAFFMIGRLVERHPRIARRVVAEGHEVGNHSYSHPIYLYRSARETERQLERTQEVIAAATGVRPRWSRPPCGVRTRAYFRASRALGLRTVQWTVAGYDWKPRPAQEIAQDVVRGLSAGSIVLLHDGDSQERRDRRETVAAVPRIIAGARARGLAICPLARLLDPRTPSSDQDADDPT
jgi:peptidoglycan/xylan/chitin deacetylase (PgdA/CDA1 family)